MKEPQMENKKRNIFYSPIFIRKYEHRINLNWITGSETPLEEGLATPRMRENSLLYNRTCSRERS